MTRTHTQSKKLGMWLFLTSDTLTFATFLVCYIYSRLSNSNWPAPFDFSPAILTATLMTLILLTSSLTMVFAVQAMQAANRPAAARWLAATILCGIAFLMLHTTEWRHLWQIEKVTPSSNPWGVPLFGATFYGLTGFHILHVVCGVIYLSVIAIAIARGKFSTEDVETSGLYWHFVDLVWMFIFPFVYLMSVKA